MTENNRILIVDDEPKNLKILRIRLEKDYELMEASSGEQALEVIEDFKPALVLLDIMMEGINGYEVTQKIKRNDKVKNCKVILVSGKAMIEEKLEGYHAGAEDYITKPFNGEELKAKVAVFMELYNLESQLNNINESLEQEVKMRSEQLLKAERMAFVGLHTSEIVHNLKNPLAVIKGYLFKLKKKQPDLKELDKIEGATNKILEIIKKLLTSFNRDLKVEITYFSLSDVIEEELEFLESLDSGFKENIALTLNLNGTAMVNASKSHVSQVVGNIIKNAIESMMEVEAPALTITTENLHGEVLLTIEDTGTGIAKEHLEKIYEPLFTTKDGSKGEPIGNGLGLPFCKRMVETYGGKLSIDSEQGRGTLVTIKLPAKTAEDVEGAA